MIINRFRKPSLSGYWTRTKTQNLKTMFKRKSKSASITMFLILQLSLIVYAHAFKKLRRCLKTSLLFSRKTCSNLTQTWSLSRLISLRLLAWSTNHLRWSHLSSRHLCLSCKQQFSCLAWKICLLPAWTYLIWMSSLQVRESRWLNWLISAMMTTSNTLWRSVATLWAWASLWISRMTRRPFCTIYFRRSSSTRVRTCHDPDRKHRVTRLAGGAMCQERQRRTVPRNRRTLIFPKLSFEVADAGVTWTRIGTPPKDWKLSIRRAELRPVSVILVCGNSDPLLPSKLKQI